MVNPAFADGPAPAASPRQQYEKKENLKETPGISLKKQSQRLECILELVADPNPSCEKLIALIAVLGTGGLKVAVEEFGLRQDIDPRDKKGILKGAGFAIADLSNSERVARQLAKKVAEKVEQAVAQAHDAGYATGLAEAKAAQLKAIPTAPIEETFVDARQEEEVEEKSEEPAPPMHVSAPKPGPQKTKETKATKGNKENAPANSAPNGHISDPAGFPRLKAKTEGKKQEEKREITILRREEDGKASFVQVVVGTSTAAQVATSPKAPLREKSGETGSVAGSVNSQSDDEGGFQKPTGQVRKEKLAALKKEKAKDQATASPSDRQRDSENLALNRPGSLSLGQKGRGEHFPALILTKSGLGHRVLQPTSHTRGRLEGRVLDHGDTFIVRVLPFYTDEKGRRFYPFTVKLGNGREFEAVSPRPLMWSFKASDTQ